MSNKWCAALVLICATVAAGLLVNVLHFLAFPVGVILYDTVLDIVIGAGAVVLIYAVLASRWVLLSRLELVLSVGLGLAIGFNYAIAVPTVIDRSLSIYILEKLDQRGGGIRQDAMARVFTDEYLPEHRLVDIRLTEQLNSGTITIEDGCVRLTDRGRRIIRFTYFYRHYILPKRREIMGQLSADLTDPFRNSRDTVDYACGPSSRTASAPTTSQNH